MNNVKQGMENDMNNAMPIMNTTESTKVTMEELMEKVAIEKKNATMESLKSRIKEIIADNEHPNKDNGIEIYLDYRDEFSKDALHKIMTEDNPREYFNQMMDDITMDYIDYARDNLEETILNNLSEEESDFFNAYASEVWEWIMETYYFYIDEAHYNKTVNVNIMLDTGNLNYDCACDNVLNYCGNGEFDKDSSILWLAKQMKKTGLLRKAVKEYNNNTYKEGDKFIDSCIQELENLTSHMGTLTFLVNMSLFEYFDLREAMKAEKKLNGSYYLEQRKGKGTITLSKNTMCGLFNPWSGSGSVLEIELDNDVTIPIKCIWVAEIETGKSEYGYSVDDVYGLVGSAWKGTVKETKYMTEEEIKAISKETEVA